MHIETHQSQVGSDAPSSHPATSTGFLSQLKIYSGTFSDKSLLTLFLSPFPLMFSPVVRVDIHQLESESRAHDVLS